jgi:hypothetical protein
VDHRATEASRGVESTQWQLEKVLRHGYALATAYYGDLEPDHPAGWKDGIRAALSPQGAQTVWQDSDWGAIGAWAWGLSRMSCTETRAERGSPNNCCIHLDLA